MPGMKSHFQDSLLNSTLTRARRETADDDLLLYVNHVWAIGEQKEYFSQRLSGDLSIEEAKKELVLPEDISIRWERLSPYISEGVLSLKHIPGTRMTMNLQI